MEPKQFEPESMLMTFERERNEGMCSNGRAGTAKNDILAVIANYKSELEIIAILKQLRDLLNPKHGQSRGHHFVQDDVDVACLGIVTGSGRILQKIVDLEAALAEVRRYQISYDSRMYEMTAVSGMSLTLPVRICGFRSTTDEMFLLFLAFFKEVVMPEGKQYVVYYDTYDSNILLTFHGVNVINRNQRLCEIVTLGQNNEDVPANVIHEFMSGDLQGLFLPIDGTYEPEFLKSLLGNVSYIFNFYLPPPILEPQMRSYWKRVGYSRWVQSPYGLTVVDFVDPENRKFYDKMHFGRGFILTIGSYPPFWGVREDLIPPPPPPRIETISEFQFSSGSRANSLEVEQIPKKNEFQQFPTSCPVMKTEALGLNCPAEQNNIFAVSPTPDPGVCHNDHLILIQKEFNRNPSFEEFQEFRRNELLKSSPKLNDFDERKRSHPDFFHPDDSSNWPTMKKRRYEKQSNQEMTGPSGFQLFHKSYSVQLQSRIQSSLRGQNYWKCVICLNSRDNANET